MPPVRGIQSYKRGVSAFMAPQEAGAEADAGLDFAFQRFCEVPLRKQSYRTNCISKTYGAILLLFHPFELQMLSG